MTGRPWQPPTLPAGSTVAILASGESMSAEVADRACAAGAYAIAINATFRLAPWAWMLYGADHEWWLHPDYRDALRFEGHRVTIATGPAHVPRCVEWMLQTGVTGFDPKPGHLRTGGNSGYQALHIAIQAGAARVLLCGLDMRGGHWHGDHPVGLKKTDPEQYARWIQRFEALRDVAQARGVEVVNCTPGSALRCFRSGDLREELARADSEPRQLERCG